MPKTTSRESSAAYAQRNRKRGFVLYDRKTSRVRILLLVVLIAAVVLAAAAGVSWLVFEGQADGKMRFDDPALSEVLSVPQEDTEPYYVLVEGDFYDSMREPDGPHLLMLVRIDPAARVVTLLSVPQNIEMTLSDERYHVLSYAQLLGGDAELVTQVENLCGVELSHVVKIDAVGFTSLVDALGGVTVDLAQEADDPDTGSIYIPAGRQTLDGQQALTLVRCDNYTTPLETRSHVQAQVIEALCRAVVDKPFLGLLSDLDKIAGHIKTTMPFDQVWNLAKSFGEGGFTLYSGMVPGQISVDPDGVFFSVDRAVFDNMMEAIKEGRNPDEAATISGLTPDLVKVTVKNGAGITGGAAQVAEMLESVGYRVPETGNTENYVYDETLVVYKSELMKPTAEDILSIMGNGRTIDAGLFYEFDTDILVIVGKDWTPAY